MIIAYIDGGARGNPGPAGYGVRIESADGETIAALQWAVDNDQRHVHIRADSELLVKQMRGEYKVKHPGLQPLFVRARLLVMQLDRVVFEHVRRELNKEADRLSNLGMDEAEAQLRSQT
jgi:ribonuclease HI